MFPDNDWYGHKKILFQYCGIKKVSQIYGTLQHGVRFSKNNLSPSESLPDAPYFCWSKEIEKKFKSNIFKVNSIGAPFLYLCKIKKINKKTPKGVVLFPAHSNPEGLQDVDHSKIINIIKKKYKAPYKVVFFFTDYKKKNIDIYKKNNFKVFCCGNRGNPMFLDNLYKILNSVKYFVCTEPSTALIYSMYLKKNCKIIDKDEYSMPLNSRSNMNLEKLKKTTLYKKLCRGTMSINDQFRYAQKKLGEESIKSPEELKKIINIDNLILRIKAFLVSHIYNFRFGTETRTLGFAQTVNSHYQHVWLLDKKTKSFRPSTILKKNFKLNVKELIKSQKKF